MANQNDGYTFYKGLDSFGYDALCVGKLSIDELKKICNSSDNYIGFNTFGYIKNFIRNKNEFKPVNSLSGQTDGLYIHNEKLIKLKKESLKYYTQFEDYDFYPGMDSPGNDAYQINPNTSLQEMKMEVDESNNAGFNTLGFVKKIIRPHNEFLKLNTKQYFQGVYVKKQKYRVKMICNWTSSEGLCNEWNKMSKGNYTWNDIEITWTDDNIDFYVIINKPSGNEKFIPEKTIVLQMEPWCGNPEQNWGVKTWGIWAKPNETSFLQVRTHENYLNNTFWQLDTTYTQFKNMFNIKKTEIISSICSSKYFDPGHIKRIDFLKFVESKDDNLVQIHIFNHDNQHKFKNYKGKHIPNKDAGMMPYKYYFMPENNEEHNFITEKIWEPLLCESLCFYWGCPNITDWFDTRCYILLDMNDFEKSYNIIRDAILNDEWGKRLDIIRREKQKVLDYYNFFPTLERIIKQEFKFNYKPTDDEIFYHKYFKDIIPNLQLTKNIAKKICFIHSCNTNNNLSILCKILNTIIETKTIDELDYVYVVNLGIKINYDKLNHIKYEHKIKIKIINYAENTKLFEKPTVNLVNLFSRFNDSKILYLHTKGTSYNGENNNVNDWTNYMLYFLLNKHQLCLDMLNIYDTVGCNYNEKPFKHYSGNFWWADSKYIRTLAPITSNDRHASEWYILSGNNVNMYNLNSSNVDHYINAYPLAKYVNSLPDDKFYKFPEDITIKCVNLVRRLDRKQSMTTLLKDNSLYEHCNFIEAVDGKFLEITDDVKTMFADNDFGSRPGVIGCALSHYNIWNSLSVDSMFEKYLVFEDDIELTDRFLFKFNHVINLINNMKLDWDIIYLGYSTRVQKNYTDKKIGIFPYDLANNIGGTFCYLISKRGANKFLSFIEKNGIKHGIDYLMFKYHKEMDLKQYQVTIPLVFSECVRNGKVADSDIQYDSTKLF